MFASGQSALPDSLWDRMDSEFIQMSIKDDPTIEEKLKKGNLTKNPEKLFVYLQEKNKGSLDGKTHQLIYEEGGGELPMDRFLSEKNLGAFRMFIGFNSGYDLETLKVFHLNNFKDPNDEKACMKYRDITTYFHHVMSKSGFQASSIRNFHIQFLGGTFIFVGRREGNYYYSQLNITDKRYPDMFCRL